MVVNLDLTSNPLLPIFQLSIIKDFVSFLYQTFSQLSRLIMTLLQLLILFSSSYKYNLSQSFSYSERQESQTRSVLKTSSMLRSMGMRILPRKAFNTKSTKSHQHEHSETDTGTNFNIVCSQVSVTKLIFLGICLSTGD